MSSRASVSESRDAGIRMFVRFTRRADSCARSGGHVARGRAPHCYCHRHALRQVTRLIDIGIRAVAQCGTPELRRNDLKIGCSGSYARGSSNHVVGELLISSRLIADHDQLPVGALTSCRFDTTLSYTGVCLATATTGIFLVDERNRSVLHLGGRISSAWIYESLRSAPLQRDRV